MVAAGCKPKGCNQPRAAPWVGGNALIKVSRSVRAASFMRGNAPWHCELRARGAWHFLRNRRKNAECINRGVRSPGRCPGLWATLGLCIMSAALGIARTSSALRSLARHFSPPQSFTHSACTAGFVPIIIIIPHFLLARFIRCTAVSAAVSVRRREGPRLTDWKPRLRASLTSSMLKSPSGPMSTSES